MQTFTDLRPLHRRALELAGPVLAQVRPSDLTRPTPCAGWDLRALLGHVIGQNHGFADAVEATDAPLSAYADRPPHPAAVGGDWDASAERVASAFAAAPLDRRVLLVEISGEHRFPVAVVVGLHLLDTVVHTWDVATALGLGFRPDDELVAAAAAQARQIPGGPARERPGAAFGPEVSVPSPDEWSRTLALLGRTA